MSEKFDAIIVTTAADYKRVRCNYKRIVDLMPADKLIFVGNSEVGELVASEPFADRLAFINENDILPFDDVHKIVKEILGRDDVPRGVTGWYYQQFLKMKYAEISEHDYYMSWDGDTVPTKAFSMFDEVSGKPYFDLKYEYHKEYFETMNRLFPGMGKVIRKSFISEHMLFKKEYMLDFMSVIERNGQSEGSTFYEKILKAIKPGDLLSSSYSEFETYGTFVALKHTDAYKLRDWHSVRYGSIYFIPDKMTEDDFEWLSHDFDAVSFEKNQDYNPGIAALFTAPQYRNTLTARQIVEAIQESSSEGMEEVWED